MELINIFMKRDNMTYQEAYKQLEYMKERLREGDDPEEVLYDENLEPDYILDILYWQTPKYMI